MYIMQCVSKEFYLKIAQARTLIVFHFAEDERKYSKPTPTLNFLPFCSDFPNLSVIEM